MTQVRLKCKICGKEETIEIVHPKRFDPENNLDMGNVYVRQITNKKELQTDQSSSRDKMC
jgi:rRNA maturation protein Nop10